MSALVREGAVARRALFALLASLGFACTVACGDDDARRGPQRVHSAPDESAPAEARRVDSHVGSRACQPCHPDEYARWQDSHHRRSMAEAPGPSVRADFVQGAFQAPGLAARFTTGEDGSLMASLDGPSAGGERFRVSYALGYTPLQEYLIEFPDGRVQVFPVAWDTEGARFFQFGETDLATGPISMDTRPGALHWRGVFNNWNLMCATCHVTELRKNYDPARDSYSTTWSEIHVGCEACHGPGERHLRWAENPRAGGDGSGMGARGLRPMPERADMPGFRDEVVVCGPCHSRREAITSFAPVGAPFYDHFVPELLRENLYFPDGQIRDEVFVLGSFLQSEMYRRGVTCSNCHDAHSGRLLLAEPDLCTRCHAAPLYDVPAHHLHEPGSAGSRCTSCHMPERVYMGVDPRRDHRFHIPRPDLSETLGTPDACTGCHHDQTAAWAARAIAHVHGPRDASEPPTMGEILAAGRRRAPGADEGLMALAGDAARPAIVRATALELLQAYPGARAAESFAHGLRSDEPLIRRAAIDGTRGWSAQKRASALAPLLRDPTRAVRIQAARALVDLESRMAPESIALSWYRDALDEYRAAQEANLDHPGARFNLGALHDARGDAHAAEREYRAALALAPGYVPAAVNLAANLERRGDARAAVGVLEQALARTPESGELHHALGLVFFGQGRFDDAERHLERAVALLPPDAELARAYDAARAASQARPE